MKQRSIWTIGLPLALLLGTADAAFAQDCTGAIGDFVFFDVNENGLQDGPDEGLAGVVARLTDEAGNVLEATSTEIVGYGFFGLCAGEYLVEVVSVPAGFVPAVSDVGDDDTVDSDPSPITVILPTDHTFDNTIDFGFVLGEEEGCGLELDASAVYDTVSTGSPWCHNDGALAIYRYELSNVAADPIYWTVLIDDQLGFVSFAWKIKPGTTKVRYGFGCLSESTSSTVTATGHISRERCSASDSVSVTVIPGDDDD